VSQISIIVLKDLMKIGKNMIIYCFL